MEIAEFIAARLDEDEAAANEVHLPRTCGSVDRDASFDPDPIWCGCDYPARALREVAAKRAILAGHQQTPDPKYGSPDPCCLTCLTSRDGYQEDWRADPWPCETIRQLAAVYGDHPDYRAEWKP